MPTVIEYKLVRCNTVAEDMSVEDFLNGYGVEGWFLCGTDYGCFIFARPKAM